jgi:hypothetical protein
MRIRHPESGMETVRIRDPGWKKVGSGINIPDPQRWIFPTLICSYISRIFPSGPADSGYRNIGGFFIHWPVFLRIFPGYILADLSWRIFASRAGLLHFSGFFPLGQLAVGMTWLDYKISSVSCVIEVDCVACCLLAPSAESADLGGGWWVVGGRGPVLFVRNIWRPLSIEQSTFSLEHIILYKFHSDPTLHPLGKPGPSVHHTSFCYTNYNGHTAPSRAVFRIRIRIRRSARSICFWTPGSTSGSIMYLYGSGSGSFHQQEKETDEKL